MKKRDLLLSMAVSMAVTAAAGAFDTIKKVEGTSSGRVVSISPKDVVIEVNRVNQTVPVNEIVTIFFDDEPSSMRTAKTNVINGAYENGLEQLGRIDPADLNRPELQADAAFYKAFCLAQLALGGSGKVADATTAMNAFIGSAAGGSYHYLEANEILGDLYVAAGNYAGAEAQYGKVARAPFQDYRMRAGVSIGRARLAQGKIPEAQQAFDAVLGMEATDDLSRAQRMAATLGKARCVAAGGNAESAVKVVNDIIANSSPEDMELRARAYNTLGTALRKSGKEKEALMAFLRVDLLYFNVPEAHAEALSNLNELWTKYNKADRAVRCRQLLQTRYGNSPWARSVGGGG